MGSAVHLGRGAFAGVVAPGGDAGGAVAQGEGVLDGDDLDAGHGAKPASSYWPAPAVSRIMSRVGGVRVRKMPMPAPSRSITPRRSRIMADPTLSPALTETMARPSCLGPNKMLPSIPLSAPRLDRLPGCAPMRASAHFSNSK